MKITINFNDCESAFKKCGRGEQFSITLLVFRNKCFDKF